MTETISVWTDWRDLPPRQRRKTLAGSGQSETVEERVSVPDQGRCAEQVAIILDDMHLPPSKLDQDTDHAEVTVAVTLKASLCDLDTEVNTLDLRRSVAEAVDNAVHHHEQVGFDHALADIVSLGLVEVRALNAE